MGYAEDVKAARDAEMAKYDGEPQVEIPGTEPALSPEGVPYQGGYPLPAEEAPAEGADSSSHERSAKSGRKDA